MWRVIPILLITGCSYTTYERTGPSPIMAILAPKPDTRAPLAPYAAASPEVATESAKMTIIEFLNRKEFDLVQVYNAETRNWETRVVFRRNNEGAEVSSILRDAFSVLSGLAVQRQQENNQDPTP